VSQVEKDYCMERLPGHVERVGILGGSFDPIHLGHLILAEAALEELSLNRIIFIPAQVSPHKQGTPPQVSAAERLRMVELAIEGESRFSVDDRELKRGTPSYTIETVRSLLGDYPGVRFLYLIGADNIGGLESWYRIDELKNLVDFAVFDRGDGIHCNTKEYQVVHRRIDISSTEIRDRLAKGLSIQYFLPTPLRDYILTHRLYTSPSLNAQA